MRVEGRDLVDLDESQAKLRSERREMARLQATVAVLDEVQEFDQEIGPARPIPEEGSDFVVGERVDLPPSRGCTGLPPTRSRMDNASRRLLVAGWSRIVNIHDSSINTGRSVAPPGATLWLFTSAFSEQINALAPPPRCGMEGPLLAV
jgi:hypothetical protein